MVRQGGHHVAVKYAMARSACVVWSVNAWGCGSSKGKEDTTACGLNKRVQGTFGQAQPYLVVLGHHHLVAAPPVPASRHHHEAPRRRRPGRCTSSGGGGYCPRPRQHYWSQHFGFVFAPAWVARWMWVVAFRLVNQVLVSWSMADRMHVRKRGPPQHTPHSSTYSLTVRSPRQVKRASLLSTDRLPPPAAQLTQLQAPEGSRRGCTCLLG